MRLQVSLGYGDSHTADGWKLRAVHYALRACKRREALATMNQLLQHLPTDLRKADQLSWRVLLARSLQDSRERSVAAELVTAIEADMADVKDGSDPTYVEICMQLGNYWRREDRGQAGARVHGGGTAGS